jgi:transcriptional regulator with XRE-family HTH domain
MIYGLGDKLVRLREGKHLQQKDIAKYSKVTPQAISGYENDTATPSLEVFSDLCAFYNASADYLLGYDKKQMLSVEGLTDDEIGLISSMITKLKEVRQAEKSDD